MFFLIAILLVMVAPLVVPVTATIVHAVKNGRQRVATAAPARTGAARPVFAPALAGAAA